MINRLMQEKIYCGLDIGSHKIKAAVVRIKESDKSEILGIFEQDMHGFKNGAVSDLSELTESIHHAIDKLAQAAQIKIKDIHLGIGADVIDLREADTVIPLIDRGNKIISLKDIERVNQQARLLGVKMEEEVLHELPQTYLVDDNNNIINPQGLYARKLGVRSLMILCNVNRIHNINTAVNHAGYDVTDFSFSSFAAASVSLSDEELSEGAVIIDIGSNVTSVQCFQDYMLKHFIKINVGGDHFTNSISKELGIPYDLAEEIKRSYAVANEIDQFSEEEILVKRENNYISIKKGRISKAIAHDCRHMLDGIYQSFYQSNLYSKINRGVTVIGGGALLPGLIDRMHEKIKMPVKLAKINIDSVKPLANPSIFASVIGLAQRGRIKGTRSLRNETEHAHWTKSFLSRVKDIYQEYF